MNIKAFSLILLFGFSSLKSDYFFETLQQHVPLAKKLSNPFTYSSQKELEAMKMVHCTKRPLYIAFPAFKDTLFCLDLGELPTPVIRLYGLENSQSNSMKLYLKDDGDTGKTIDGKPSFGGNKVRKLEFLLADAIAHNAKSVMTFGCIGSNHVVATATLARRLGLDCIAQLAPQSITDVVKRNMLLMHESGCSMVLNPNKEIRAMQAICSCVQRNVAHEDIPYVIPTGGSCPVGIVGFVNAAFELKQQINRGDMPEPDKIYVAIGSGGTLAGLILGVRAAGLKSQVIGVAVEPEAMPGDFVRMTYDLVTQTNAYLHERNSEFPLFNWSSDDIVVKLDSAGPDYGVPTDETVQAIDFFAKHDDVQLDTTYSGKAAAGMIAAIKRGECDRNVVLYWNTFCSKVPQPKVEIDSLSKPFQKFFK